MVDYNPLKLSQHLALFGKKSVAVVGAGAVGTYIVEFLTKLGVGHICIFDFDEYTLENAAKHSCIVRTPEDAGKNKALTLADRARPLMIRGGTASGFAGDIAFFGPRAFAGFDGVFLALDNYAAKMYFNRLWLQIPLEKRPILFSGGTHQENAGAYCLNGRGPCLRCTINESYLKDGRVRTSCTGVQLRTEPDGSTAVVRTSNLASVQAALWMAQGFRDYVLGDKRVLNSKFAYAPAMDQAFHIYRPMRRESCPDCHGIRPYGEAMELEGNVRDLTLRQLYEQLNAMAEGLPYYVEPYILRFDEVSYGGIIQDEYCHSCGAHLGKLYRHEGRTFPGDLLCPQCKAQCKSPRQDTARPVGNTLHALDPTNTPDELLSKMLFDLGWPIGGDIVIHIPGEGRTDLDGQSRKALFTCKGDPDLLNTNLNLLAKEDG